MLRISEDFYDLIDRFYYNDVVIKLKSLLSKNIESDYNFIKLSESNKFINFLPTAKIKEILEKEKTYKVISIRNLTHSDKNDHIFEALGYDKNCEYWYPGEEHQGTLHGEVVSEKTGNTYVLFKSLENGRYSVINKEGLIKVEPDLFNFSKNKLKVGRFVQHLFEKNNIEFKQSDIEEFVNLYKSTYDILSDKLSLFEIVEGSDISYWYNRSRYENTNGTLGNSCMADSDSSFFEIYEKNNCRMLILKSTKGIIKDGKILSDLIIGRALLWKARIINGDEVKNIDFMDRVYINNDSDENVFIEWGKQNGFWYKCEQTYYPDTSITNGEEYFDFNEGHLKRLEVDIENIYFDKYPYIDTFCYVKDEKTLTNNYRIDSDKQTCHGFRCTDGFFETYNNDNTIKIILKNDR